MLTVGAETDLQRDDRRNWVNVAGSRGALTLDQRERVNSASPFAQLSGTWGGATLLGGLRYDSYRFSAADHLITATNPDDSGIRRMSAVSPSLGLTYSFSPLLNAYANVATGFETPTTTELANQPSGAGGFNPYLQPEHTHSHEGGLKGKAGPFAYDAALYDMRIDGELIPFEVPSTPGRSFYRNAGSARHHGAELDVRADVAHDVLIRGSYSYTDARYVNYASGDTSYAGRRIPGIAPNIATVALQLGDPHANFVSLEERAESSTPVNDLNSARSPAYVVTDVRAQTRVQKWGVFGGIGNVMGVKYNTSVTINAALGRYFEPAAGRTFYVGIDLGRPL